MPGTRERVENFRQALEGLQPALDALAGEGGPGPDHPEIRWLHGLAIGSGVLLVAEGLAGLMFGLYVSADRPLAALALAGFSGGAVAALTTCLDRYASGLETSDGLAFPPRAAGRENFNQRLAASLLLRPFLGAVVAPVVALGVGASGEASPPAGTSGRALLLAFLAGMAAKSLIGAVKGMAKNIFGR